MMAAEISRHSGLLGTNSQVATDVGENRAGRAAADLGRDVPGRGQTDDAWFACGGAAVLGLGGSRLARGWGGRGARCGRLADGVVDQPGLERSGAKQAAGDARDDLPDVDGAEMPRDVTEVGLGGALLQRGGQVPAIGDQCADEGEETPGAGGCVGADGRPILVGIGAVGWAGSGGRGGHGRSKTMIGGDVSRNKFLEGGNAEPAMGDGHGTGPAAGTGTRGPRTTLGGLGSTRGGR